jgi:hypothetical protein
MKTIQRSKLGGRGQALRLFLAATVFVAGCDFLDPTAVENPRTTSDDLAQAGEPTAAFLSGLRAQFARLISSTSVVSGVVSDNFSIHGTGLAKSWDFPRDISPSLNNSTGSATGLYWNAQELKALATFVIEEIAPDDPTATAADVAEAYYYRGMAYLHLGENFSYAPVEEDGALIPSAQLLDLAITDLGQASAFGPATQAAQARAYRWLGNSAAAVSAAQGVLGADPTFVFQQEYDATSLSNQPYFFLVLRALQEMQPLPRLDFLDPKYLTRTSGIAVAKAEEMHLIMAEAALVGNDLAGARTHLANAINTALARGSESFTDEDPRLNADLSIRPRDASIMVRADAASPYRAGLVLTRPGNTMQHTISGTSLDADSVAALGSADELWHAFHLARQEILFLEGRRMADLGIKLPIMLREVDANPNVADGDPGTTSVVPAYIPASDMMDLFTPASPHDGDGNVISTEVTMQVDMNRILTDNRVSPLN